MQRITTSRKATNLFGAGKHGFTDGVPGTATLPTQFNAAWCNGIQEELAGVIEAMGIALDGGANTQLLQAVRQMVSYTRPSAAADTTGVAPAAALLVAAAAAAAAAGKPLSLAGKFNLDAQLTPPRYMPVMGTGKTSDPSTGSRAPTTLIKSFNGVGVNLANDDSGLENLQIDSAPGTTGPNAQLGGSRCFLRNVTTTRAGGGSPNVRVGLDVSGNSSLWYVQHLMTMNGTGDGMLVDDPAGPTDANGGLALQVDARGNAGRGIYDNSAAWNTYVGPVSQGNTLQGFAIGAASRGTVVLGGDLEGNNSGGAQGEFLSGAVGNAVFGAYYTSTPAWVDSSGLPGRNLAVQWDGRVARMQYGQQINLVDLADGAGTLIVGWSGVGDAKVDAGALLMVANGGGGNNIFYTRDTSGNRVETMRQDERQRTRLNAALVHKGPVLLTFGANVAIDASLGNHFQLNANAATAFTMQTPTNLVAGQTVGIVVRNTSAGALGAATWAAATFKMGSAWAQPASGQQIAIEFFYDGAVLIERFRGPSVALV